MSASAINAGRAFLRLLIDDKEFAKGLDASLKQLDGFGKSALKVGAIIGAAGTAITAPFLAGAKVFADTGSALNDMSERTGVSVERLSELKYAAAQTGTDLTTVEGALRKMAKTLSEAAGGSQSAQDALSGLGLSAGQLIGLSPGEQFAKISKAISQIADPTQRAAAAMDVFGKSGTQLLPMIQDLDHLSDTARKLGVTMSTQAAKDADRFGDALDTLKAQGGALASALGASVAPALTSFSESLQTPLANVIKFIKANGDLAASVFAVGAAIQGFAAILITVGSVAKGAEAAITGFRTAMALLSKNPWLIAITAAITGIIALTSALGPLLDRWRGIDSATTDAADATKDMAETQKTLKQSLGAATDELEKGTKAFDARVEAMKRLQDAANQKQVGSATSDIVKETKSEVEQLKDSLSRLNENRFTLGGGINKAVEDKINQIKQKIAELEKLVPPSPTQGNLLPFERGSFPGLLLPGLNFAIAQGIRAAAEVTGRQTPERGKGLPGFSTDSLKELEKVTRPILGTFNKGLAEQISPSGSNPISNKLERMIANAEKQRKSLENIDKNTARSNQFTAGNV